MCGTCPQAPELIPSKNRELWTVLTNEYRTEDFLSKAVKSLSGAVQIRTESYDDMKAVGEDPRWEIFATFHDYLKRTFPLVHSKLELTKVNTYGLIYLWKGSDATLKPLLLSAHQDVVPVDPATFDIWTQPPYSGHFDGVMIWGRGSADDKSGLIGILSTMETLLKHDYRPVRTVVLTSGFDEEIGGKYGAKYLAPKLLDMYGENGYAMLIDEGNGYGEQYGRVFATPGIAEKGYVNVTIKVTTPGGHSSLPPPHTSIGFLAGILVAIENNPFDARLVRDSPIFQYLQCLAQYAPDLSDSYRKDIIDAEHSDEALQSVEKVLFSDETGKNRVRTTQAIVLVNGGVKVNALPEQAWATLNHRIAIESNVAATVDHNARPIESYAREHDLSYTGPNGNIDNGVNKQSTVKLTFDDAFEPAQKTPTNASPFKLLSGSIKAAYNSHRGISGNDNIIVSPGMLSGNTDARYYSRLTHHIFRYLHTERPPGQTLMPGVHTVNEAISLESFVELIQFYTVLILNADETQLT